MRALLALLLLALPAAAHGPWSPACCSDRDCAEIDSAFVVESGDEIHVTVPPGGHPLWPKAMPTPWRATFRRGDLQKPVTGEWGLCISAVTFRALCLYPPAVGG